MDVDGENLKASQNVSSLREITWAEEDNEEYKQLLLFEKDIAVKVRDELNVCVCVYSISINII